jgi:hypothetical protein
MQDLTATTWLTRFLDQAQAHAETRPLLAEALRPLSDGQPNHEIATQALRLLGSGWTLDQIETGLRDLQAEVRSVRLRHGLSRLATLAHLPRAEFEQWAEAFDGSLLALTDEGVVQAVTVWRVVVPGPLAPLCAAAGLDPDEAAEMVRSGELDTSVLTALQTLRRTGIPGQERPAAGPRPVS